MPIVIPRLIVELFQHTNFRGRMGYVVEPVPFTAHIGFQDNMLFTSRLQRPKFLVKSELQGHPSPTS